MRHESRNHGLRRSRAVLLLAALGAVAWWWIDHASHTATSVVSHPTELAALVAPKTQSLAPKTTELDVGANGRSGLEVTGNQARQIQARSPLESSPGYYPPADPESLAAVNGRRDAPPVEGEFSGGAASLEDLAREILAGLEQNDERALHALRVTQDEFERIIWPEMPQSRPITNIPFSEVW